MPITTYILWMTGLITLGLITYAVGIEYQILLDMQDLRDGGYTTTTTDTTEWGTATTTETRF